MRETFRVWAETLEAFYLEVISEERHDFKANLTRSLLTGRSKLFQICVKILRWLINVRILRDSTLGVQVIAVGNLTVGGTGKTPVVEKFARELRDQGRNVAILSRGYRSKPPPLHQRLLNKLLLREDTTPPRVVSDGKSLLLDSEMAGDEPYMLASNLKDVVVLVDKDRVKSGRYAIEKFGCDTLLLDDGFQYWKLRGRRQDIVLIDRQQPFGNERLLPRGTLREPPSHLARASTIFITKSDGNTAELRRRIAQFNPTPASSSASITRSTSRMCSPASGSGLDFLKRQQGRVAERHRAAGKLRAKPGAARRRSWSIPSASPTTTASPSRKSSTPSTAARSARPSVIITTQKDAVRFPKIDRRDLPIYFMRVEIKILRGADDFQDCVRKICFR